MTDVKEAQKLLNEIRRVLAINGRLFLICPDFLDFGPTFFDADYSHSFITTRNRLSQMLVDSGFILEEFHFIYGPFNYFPGIFCNLAVKLFFLLIHPIRKLLAIENVYTANCNTRLPDRFILFARRKRMLDLNAILFDAIAADFFGVWFCNKLNKTGTPPTNLSNIDNKPRTI